jgi:Skp family chaperone for outer membrane proteins
VKDENTPQVPAGWMSHSVQHFAVDRRIGPTGPAPRISSIAGSRLRHRAGLQQLRTRERPLEAVNLELEGLKEGSKAYERQFNKQALLAIERKTWLEMQQMLMLREHHRLTRDMYEQIRATIATVAKAKGYQIVLFRDQEELIAQNTAELVQEIARRKLLYASSEVDVTDDVLLRLNAEYRSNHN